MSALAVASGLAADIENYHSAKRAAFTANSANDISFTDPKLAVALNHSYFRHRGNLRHPWNLDARGDSVFADVAANVGYFVHLFLFIFFALLQLKPLLYSP